MEPWYPEDGWDTPPRSAIKESPETEWFMWIARVVDKIEDEATLRPRAQNPTRTERGSLTMSVSRLLGLRILQKKGIPFARYGYRQNVCPWYAKQSRPRASEAHELIAQTWPYCFIYAAVGCDVSYLGQKRCF